MPITDTSPYAMGPGSTPSMPAFNIPTLNNVNTNPAPAWGSSDIYKTLTAGAPQSLTNLLGPLMQQIYGTQGNLMQPLFQQQGQQAAAQAQSDAAARGLTGSSIEAGAMQGARSSADNAYSQFMASNLSNLIPQLMQSGQFDIGNQSQYYNDIAQAIGQIQAQQAQAAQFQRMLDANIGMANSANTTGLETAGIGALAGLGSSAMKFSDIRLKENIVPLGKYKGQKWYMYEFKQNNKLNLPKGKHIGVMAHEVNKKDCVSVDRGYLTVNYKRLLGE